MWLILMMNAHWIADVNTERVLDTDPMVRNWIAITVFIWQEASDGSKVGSRFGSDV